ncbi:DUF4865 family protein [Streptomyces daliensis]|uniref:DUF4865 family protein n=1 Tax=Streptomyces daliensis TaxID=299421 RepID=A0A8T4IWD2_9ACTN|nr:DUF4865 family protein [Streptomyces daliensis]
MHAMQYEITLPADYDMGFIRRRVAAKGHLLDGHQGLGLKAYAIRERAAEDAPGPRQPVNQYAPFYLWEDPSALTDFLRGPGFQGLSADFGRPTVRNWHGLGHADGPARGAVPRAAERRTWVLPPGEDVGAHAGAALDGLRELARQPGVHTAALGLDPHRWELVRFVLRDGTTAPGEGDGNGEDAYYEVLHLSEGPGL